LAPRGEIKNWNTHYFYKECVSFNSKNSQIIKNHHFVKSEVYSLIVNTYIPIGITIYFHLIDEGDTGKFGPLCS
jgi:hypothetical protein